MTLLFIYEQLYSFLISRTENSGHGASGPSSGVGEIHGWVFYIVGSFECQRTKPAPLYFIEKYQI